MTNELSEQPPGELGEDKRQHSVFFVACIEPHLSVSLLTELFWPTLRPKHVSEEKRHVYREVQVITATIAP
jgi:hypothetical protein